MNAVETKPKDIVRSTVGDAVRVALILHGAEQTAQLIADALDAESLATLHDALGRLRDPLDEPYGQCTSAIPCGGCDGCMAMTADHYAERGTQRSDEPDDEPLDVDDEVEIVGDSFINDSDRIGETHRIEEPGTIQPPFHRVAGSVYHRRALRRVPAESGEAEKITSRYRESDDGIYDSHTDNRDGSKRGGMRLVFPIDAEKTLNEQHATIERLTRERDEARAERDERPTRDELIQVTRAADRMSDEIDGLRGDVRAAERAYEHTSKFERNARIVLEAVRLDRDKAHEQRRDAEAQVARLAEVLHGHLELMRTALNDATSEQEVPF